ncbi:MAG: DUF2244 domain-containing protein [Burkholderiales bacterium]|nr:DUF2244 domain-containing protein [Burkholderiales bacterium]
MDSTLADDTTEGWSLFAKRNDSLTPRGRRLFFGSLVLVCSTIAAVWASQGAWYVIPFTCVELAVVYAALWMLQRHASDYELLRIDGDTVHVEHCRLGQVTSHRFNRHWAKLVVEHVGPGDRVALAVRSHGREVRFGEFLTDEQKLSAAQTLRRKWNDR